MIFEVFRFFLTQKRSKMAAEIRYANREGWREVQLSFQEWPSNDESHLQGNNTWFSPTEDNKITSHNRRDTNRHPRKMFLSPTGELGVQASLTPRASWLTSSSSPWLDTPGVHQLLFYITVSYKLWYQWNKIGLSGAHKNHNFSTALKFTPWSRLWKSLCLVLSSAKMHLWQLRWGNQTDMIFQVRELERNLRLMKIWKRYSHE